MRRVSEIKPTALAITIVLAFLFIAIMSSISHGDERIQLRSFDGGKTFYGTGDYRGAIRSYGGTIYMGRLKSRSGNGDIRIRSYGHWTASPFGNYGYLGGSYPGRTHR